MSIVKLPELSNILGIGQRQINKLAKAGIIPKARRGEYDLAGTVRAYIDYLKDGVDTDKKEAIVREELRIKRLQAEKLEDEKAVRRRYLLSVNDFVSLVEASGAAIKSILSAIPKQAARERGEKQLEEYLENHINKALNELSNLSDYIGGLLKPEGEIARGVFSVQTTPKAKGKRVVRRKQGALV